MKKVLVIGLSGESVFLKVDHFNNKGETVNALTKHTEPGGKGYNQAYALGKLNANVSFITVLGSDNYKDECIKYLNDVNCKNYIIYKNIPSSYAVITVDKHSENHVVVYSGASSLITFDDLMIYKDVIDSADIVLLQLEYNKDCMVKLIKYLHDINKYIILNPAPVNYLDIDTLKMCNIITPNEFECQNIPNDFENIIVTTLSDKGAIKKEKGKTKLYAPYKTKPVDTTGAGDTFNASLAYYLSIDKTIDEAIDFANLCSSYMIRKEGIINAVGSIDDIMKYKGEFK